MKKYLIPPTGRFFKANLHCHTTVSDGMKTPEQIKALYTANGYSVVAFTDHDVLVPHPELQDGAFLPLNGFEAEIEEPGSADWANRKQCHLCFIAKDPENLTMPFYHRTRYIWGGAEHYRAQLRYDDSQPDYIREYSHAGISDMIRRGREAGFFVTYNHPAWSREDYPDYMGYQGMDAMEIMNYGCCCEGYLDYNPRVYDDLLHAGRKLYCIAADDNHGRIPDECGGWTMIKAEGLDYKSITKALELGHFYASWGPEIRDLWVEDGEIHITCAPASRIIATYGSRRSRMLQGEALTEGAFPLRPDDGYVRITVVDEQGRCADTNACFMEEILNEITF
ncbi:MAG: PHP domain-containing protein [Oscillospiraceae bacterium]|nr:PHP domain-containing protein [Oscillospiraceae bacterium]